MQILRSSPGVDLGYAFRQAPVSLVKALQEYLDDPNFEQNRTEYKENKGVVDGKSPQKGKKTRFILSVAVCSCLTALPRGRYISRCNDLSSFESSFL